jgi:hypothetical protein
MNTVIELDRLTAPPFKASRIRILSRTEIDELVASGRITPVGLIPAMHHQSRISVPERSSYAR